VDKRCIGIFAGTKDGKIYMKNNEATAVEQKKDLSSGIYFYNYSERK
jgi:hypothetical protein